MTTCQERALKRAGSTFLMNEPTTIPPPNSKSRNDNESGKKPASGARTDPNGSLHASKSATMENATKTTPLMQSGWQSNDCILRFSVTWDPSKNHRFVYSIFLKNMHAASMSALIPNQSRHKAGV